MRTSVAPDSQRAIRNFPRRARPRRRDMTLPGANLGARARSSDPEGTPVAPRTSGRPPSALIHTREEDYGRAPIPTARCATLATGDRDWGGRIGKGARPRGPSLPSSDDPGPLSRTGSLL